MEELIDGVKDEQEAMSMATPFGRVAPAVDVNGAFDPTVSGHVALE
jgi:hypothetical protein